MMDDTELIPKQQPQWKTCGVFLIFLFPALGGLLFGYDIGATSYVLTQLEDEWSQVHHSTLLQGAITSSCVGGAFIGSLIVFKIADSIGRNKEMRIAAQLYVLGGALEFISGLLDQYTGLYVLLGGRWIYGIGCGFAMHGAPTYIAEMAPAEVRGMLVSLKEAMIVLGILSGYLFGFGFSHYRGLWIITYGVSVIPGIIMFFGILTIPQSARWLVLRGKLVEAKRALRFVYVDDESVDAVFREITAQSSSLAQDTTKIKLFTSTYKRALIAGIGLVTLQQVTGQPSILYYANQIFEDAGMASYSAVLTGAFKLFATLGSVAVVDKYGRRWLLFVGVSMMFVALAVMTVAFAGYKSSDGDDDDDDGGSGFTLRTGIIIVGMFLYIGGYQVSFGPISWLMISEIFPLEVRGEAVAVAVQSNFGWNLIVTFVYPEIVSGFGSLFGESYNYCAAFGLFCALTAYSLWFIKWNVPETKGLTLEEIDELLRNPSSMPKRTASTGLA